MDVYKRIARKIPGIRTKLRQASIYDEPEEYVKKIFFTAAALSGSITLIVFTFTLSFLAFVGGIIIFPLLFVYLLKYVDVKIERIRKMIDQEIIFAGRYLIIEMESGVPIYESFENVKKSYRVAGSYFGDIVDRVYLGTSFEDAINETMLITPSSNLRKMLWQILNSSKTGANISASLNTILDQAVREQQIAVNEYGKKLNPLAMFYMMISIIIPSLGITMLVILATFMGLNITMPFFILIAMVIGLVQFMFLSMVKSARPPIST